MTICGVKLNICDKRIILSGSTDLEEIGHCSWERVWDNIGKNVKFYSSFLTFFYHYNFQPAARTVLIGKIKRVS